MPHLNYQVNNLYSSKFQFKDISKPHSNVLGPKNKMYDNPISLKEICLETISNNVEEVFDVYYEPEGHIVCSSPIFSSPSKLDELIVLNKKFRFRDQDLFLFNEISESLLQKLSEKDVLCDSTLNIFNGKNTRLKHVKIKNAKRVTYDGLRVLRDHKIVTLECNFLRNVCINKIIGCLGDWSVQNITALNISHCSFIDSSRHCLLVALSQLKNLRYLNVSYTEFNQSTLQLVCEELRYLRKLNISGTPIIDFTSLLRLKDQLVCLIMCDCAFTRKVAAIINRIWTLKYLDISLSEDQFEISDNRGILKILEDYEALPNLISLELSGWRNFIPTTVVEEYLIRHPKLKYFGFVLNLVVFEPILSDQTSPYYNPNLVVAGVASESQIKVCLHRHYKRASYVQKALYYLFEISGQYCEVRPDIFELVLPAMAAHPIKFGVQMAATACLYNLTRFTFSKFIHPRLLRKAVELTLNSMDMFSDNTQLQKNGLLILCSDRILQDVTFDHFRCATLVLEVLCTYDDCNMIRMAVAICSILAAKISTDETSKLGKEPKYMRKLLSIVLKRVESKILDITLKFTLSALWNLTDESEITCSVFLQEGGAELFLYVLRVFNSHSVIETKVLGLLNNIAEVKTLRHNLMLDELFVELSLLIKSELIDVSYFAAGVVAHLASDGSENWTVQKYTREEMLNTLGNTVTNWHIPETEMVAYRSFKPFLPLLEKEIDYRIQLWAVWAIHHVCSKNPRRYCEMLRNDAGRELLENLFEDPNTHPEVKTLVGQIFNCLETGYF